VNESAGGSGGAIGKQAADTVVVELPKQCVEPGKILVAPDCTGGTAWLFGIIGVLTVIALTGIAVGAIGVMGARWVAVLWKLPHRVSRLEETVEALSETEGDSQ